MKATFLRRLLTSILVTALVTGTGVPVVMVQAGHGDAAIQAGHGDVAIQAGHGHAATQADQAQGTPACNPAQALGTGCKNCAPCVMVCDDGVAVTAAAPSLEPPLSDVAVKVVNEAPGAHSYIPFKLPRGPPQLPLQG